MAIGIATRTALVNAPSPLEGEGKEPSQQVHLGEGSRAQRAAQNHPSPIMLSLQDHAALSLKGRGHNNAQPLPRTEMGGA